MFSRAASCGKLGDLGDDVTGDDVTGDDVKGDDVKGDDIIKQF